MATSIHLIAFIISTSLSVFVVSDGMYSCPTGCRCTMLRRQADRATVSAGEAAAPSGRKVACQNSSPLISMVSQLSLDSLPKDTLHLDLSTNNIEVIQRGAFQILEKLQRLNLSRNPIAVVEPGAFQGLVSLERLDLSETRLTSLNGSMLDGMPKLQRLSLLNCNIITLTVDMFKGLPSLSRLDLQTNYLVCDCHLDWFVDWYKSSGVRVSDTAACALPAALKGKQLKVVRHDDLHCNWPLVLPVFKLVPNTSQVVFETDTLPLECHVTESGAGMNVTWLHAGEEIQTDANRSTTVDARHLPDSTRVSTVVIERLDAARDSGNWTCRVTTSLGSTELTVGVVVLSRAVRYCATSVTKTARGRYLWPTSIAGVEQELSCEAGTAYDFVGGGGHGGGDVTEARARRWCDVSGRWAAPNVEQCRYTSVMTQMFENYLVMMGSNQTNPGILAEQVRRSIGNGQTITDKVDVIYLSRIIEGFSRIASSDDKLAEQVLELVSSVMDVDASLLSAAHREDKVGTRLVEAVERMTEQLLYGQLSVRLNARNVAVRAHSVEPHAFVGITCTAYSGWDELVSGRDHKDTGFYCVDFKAPDDAQQPNPVMTSSSPDRSLVASITVPDNSLKMAKCIQHDCALTESYRMLFTIYKNSKLFPLLNESLSSHQRVSSTVISGKIVGMSMEGSDVDNSTAYVTVQMSLLEHAAPKIKTPAYWASDGFGSWVTDGCVKKNISSSAVITFQCNRLASFGLLLDDPPPSTALQLLLASWYKMSVIVYFGSLFLVVCLLIVIIVYIVHRRRILMSRKSRHAVANLCTAVLLLCAIYTMGIRVTVPVIACRVIGISIHYLSLSSLLWITVLIYKMYNKLTKMQQPHPSPEEMLGEPPKPKPILTGYLLGWGVAIIICGISGAINWTNYAQNEYCFLMIEAAFLTCFIPAGVVLTVNILLILRIFCLLRTLLLAPSLHRAPIEDPDTEETHDNEIEVLAPNANRAEIADIILHSAHSNSPSFGIVEQPLNELDPAYPPLRQLIASVVLLLLFGATWVMGLFVVVQPFSFPHCELVYECLYALLAASLGVFVVCYYYACRGDIHSPCRCRQRRHSQSMESNRWRYVKTANGSALPSVDKPIQNDSAARECNVPDGSVVSARDHVSEAARSIHSDTDIGTKLPNCTVAPFSVCAPPAITVMPDVTAFYNPRQNGVARKYWERVRKKRAISALCPNESRGFDGESMNGVGSGSSLLPNGSADKSVPLKMNGGTKTVITASVENHNRHSVGLPDEQQPLLPILMPLGTNSVTPAHGEESTKNDVTGNVKAERISHSQYGTLPTSTPDGDCIVSPITGDHVEISNNFLEQLELRVPHCQTDCPVTDTGTFGHTTDSGSRSSSLPSQCMSKAESEQLRQSGGPPTPYAFMNKNYNSSINRNNESLGSMPRELDKPDGMTVLEGAASFSDASTAEVWVPQNMKHCKQKTETSV